MITNDAAPTAPRHPPMQLAPAAAHYKGEVQIHEQANALYSVYTETHAHSMADETLLAWDCDEYDALSVCILARC